MTKVTTDNRLSVAPYHEALEGVETQFALVRFALRHLSKSRIQEFFRNRLKEQISALDAGTRGLAAKLPDDQKEKVESALPSVLHLWEKQERKKNRAADTRFKLELSEDRLNQSELLLLVAHFESFMKEVHRIFLIASATTRFGEGDLKTMRGDALAVQSSHPFDKFLTEFIDKEVRRLDNQNIEQRADYFAKYFGTSFGKIDHLKDIMTKRNEVTHEIYATPPRNLEEVSEQPLVSDQMLIQARSSFWEIPRRCVEAGVKIYPAFFR